MKGMLLETIRYIVTVFGVGLINNKLGKKGPQPPTFINGVLKNPLFPYGSSLLLQNPDLVLKPLGKGSNALVKLADKTGHILWSDANSGQKTPSSIRSITDASAIFWGLIDRALTFGLANPGTIVFISIAGVISFFVLEPVVIEIYENRRLVKIERKLKRKVNEDQLTKSIISSLSNENGMTLSELIMKLRETLPNDDVQGGLALLESKDRSNERDAILRALKCLDRKN